MTQRVGANRSVLPATLYVVGVVLCLVSWFFTTLGLAMSTDPCLTDRCRATAGNLSMTATVVFLVTPVVAGAIMILARPFWGQGDYGGGVERPSLRNRHGFWIPARSASQ
jgi:hypothetical protein